MYFLLCLYKQTGGEKEERTLRAGKNSKKKRHTVIYRTMIAPAKAQRGSARVAWPRCAFIFVTFVISLVLLVALFRQRR